MSGFTKQSLLIMAQEKITQVTQGIVQKKNVSIAQDNLQIEKLKNFLDPLKPICIIACEGNVGTGKSTLLNLIALHLDNTIPTNELFEPSANLFSVTHGCSIFLKKLFFKGVQIVLMDFEGQGGITEPSRNMDDSEYEQYLNKLMCLSFVVPQVLIVCSHQRIGSSDLQKIKYLEAIHQQMRNNKINLPEFKWFLKQGSTLSPQQLTQANSILQGACPNVLKSTQLTSLPAVDDAVLDFSKRIKIQVIEDLLVSVTSNSQTLPKKAQIMTIFTDTFSMINENNFEIAYGEKLEFYKVWEEWNRTGNQIFDQNERNISNQCEAINDNGVIYSQRYTALVNQISLEIKSKLAAKGVKSQTIIQAVDQQVKIQFDLNSAKNDYLSRKRQNEIIAQQRIEAQQREEQQRQEALRLEQENQKRQQDILAAQAAIEAQRRQNEWQEQQNNRKRRNFFQRAFGW